jgi:hypothetical protein
MLAAYSKQLRPIPPELLEAKAKQMQVTRSVGLARDFGAGS